MTDPLLNYQSPHGPSRARVAAWIALLVLGSLYILGTLCVGASIGVALAGTRIHAPGNSSRFLIIYAACIACGGLGTAATYFWTAILIKRGSRRAGLVALTTAWINIAVIVLLLATVISINAMRGFGNITALLVGSMFYAIVAVLNGVAAWLARAVLREAAISTQNL